MINSIKNTSNVILSLCAIFFLFFITIGYTGSSVSCINSPFYYPLTKNIAGKQEIIRSDEYAVSLMGYISQINNQNKQNLNKNFGVDGKKMGIIHDFGSPSYELYDLGKPATWGAYLPIPVRNKISWWWVTPIFVSFLGIFILLQQLNNRQSFSNTIISIGYALAPLNTVLSFFPSYIIGLGCLALGCQLFCLKSNKSCLSIKTILIQIVSGLSASGFILSLYLPTIVGPALLLITIYGVQLYFFLRNKPKLSRYYFISLTFFFLTAFTLIGNWWINNSDAIHAILSTTYPGNREVLGGGYQLDSLIRGSFNFIAIYLHTKGFNIPPNICAFTSEYLLILPLLLMFVYAYKEKKINVDQTTTLISVFYIYILVLIFQYVGLGNLSKLILFNKSHEFAITSTIVIAQAIAISYFIKVNIKINIAVQSLLILFITVIWIFIFEKFESLNTLFKYPAPQLALALFLLTIILLLNNIKLFLISFCSISIACFLIFHPINIAHNISLSPISKFILDSSEKLQYHGRTATFGDFRYANTGVAVGIPVINATLHYQDLNQLNAVFSDFKEKKLLNRFHHTIFELGNFEGNKTITSIPYQDVIRTEFSNDFDFSKLPIDYVIGPVNFADEVHSLKHIINYNGFSLYSVKRSKP